MTPANELPIDMILFCPLCFRQHIDKDKPQQDWINRPHRSHKCDYCAYIWRPADVCTNGVATIKTKGKADLPIEDLPLMVSVQPLWCRYLTVQQQSVLFLATRGPDGAEKFHPCKDVQRAYRATVLVAAKYGRMIEYGEHVDNFMSLRSFGNITQWTAEVDNWFNNIDCIPHHFSMKLLHATEILGYMHPDERFRERWLAFYMRGVHELHLSPESELQLRMRLSDWRRADWPMTTIHVSADTSELSEGIKENRRMIDGLSRGVSPVKGGLLSYLDRIYTVNSDDCTQPTPELADGGVLRTQNGPESEGPQADITEKTYDPEAVACGCGYLNRAHPRPQCMEFNQRRLCDGRVITMTA